ncbi:MAG TPA: efflux RND transporter periplasmic adaptor subunit [Tepidisphaeraceae bacterium]|nr:efflux RND transporter periplasmic adaptor subunit [Tepidisphaeraceae bacterium]
MLCASAVMVGGCGDEAASAKAQRPVEAVAVSVVSSRVGPVQREVAVTGTLYGDEEATVSAKVPGRVTQIFTDVGDRAAPGEPLAQIEKTDYELAAAQKQMAVQAALAKLGLTDMPSADLDLDKIPTVQRARLQAANAEAKFNRGKQLHDQAPPLISDQDFADLQTAFDVARSNYDVELLTARSLAADARAMRSDFDLEQQKLRDATVRAPGAAPATTTQPAGAAAAAGRAGAGDNAKGASDRSKPQAGKYAVGARLVSVGEYVREGTPLFRLVANDPIKFRPQVPEKYQGQVQVGQKVRVTVSAYPGAAFEGTVARISPQVDVASRSFQVEILVPNADGRLQAGAFANGAILTRTQADVTLVPVEAIVTFAGVSKVFSVADGKAIEHKIDVGQPVGDAVEVVRGFKGIAPLVASGKNRLASGVPVTVGPATTAPATAPASRP